MKFLSCVEILPLDVSYTSHLCFYYLLDIDESDDKQVTLRNCSAKPQRTHSFLSKFKSHRISTLFSKLSGNYRLLHLLQHLLKKLFSHIIFTR